MIIADTSGLLAFFHADEPAHPAASAAVAAADGPLIVSPFVLAELDYLVAKRLGTQAELEVLAEISAGAYDLATFDRQDIVQAQQLISRYADQRIGLTDASLVVLAERYRTRSILTLDHRHFAVLRPLSGGRFKLLP